jgi:hypothetical protein
MNCKGPDMATQREHNRPADGRPAARAPAKFELATASGHAWIRGVGMRIAAAGGGLLLI